MIDFQNLAGSKGLSYRPNANVVGVQSLSLVEQCDRAARENKKEATHWSLMERTQPGVRVHLTT